MKLKRKDLLITTLIALFINIGVMLYESTNIPFSENMIRIISDGFFVSGIAILIFAVLTFVSNEGGLYFMGYLGHRLRYVVRKVGKPIHYYEYVEMKKEEGKLNLSSLFIVSLIEIFISFILAMI